MLEHAVVHPMRHRIQLAPEAELESRSSDSIIDAVLEDVAAPRT